MSTSGLKDLRRKEAEAQKEMGVKAADERRQAQSATMEQKRRVSLSLPVCPNTDVKRNPPLYRCLAALLKRPLLQARRALMAPAHTANLLDGMEGATDTHTHASRMEKEARQRLEQQRGQAHSAPYPPTS